MMNIRFCIITLFLLLSGCSAVSPPTDYYQKTLEMEIYGDKTRQNSGRNPGDVVETPENPENNTIVAKIPQEPTKEILPRSAKQELHDNGLYIENHIADLAKSPEIQIPSSSPEFAPYMESRPSKKSIAISSMVIKSALEIAGLNINSVELLNGRLNDGKNSVKVDYVCDSVKSVNDKFFTICAVIYHLDKSSNTIDIVMGIAQDPHSNVIGMLRSGIDDVSAWMNNLITRAEWLSRINKEML